MEQTDIVVCPHCKENQNGTIYDLTSNSTLDFDYAIEFEGSFQQVCDKCGKVFKIEYEYKPYVETLLVVRYT